MGRAVVIVGLVAALGVALVGIGRSRPVEPGDTNFAGSPATETGPRILEFYASWCSTCLQMKPVVEALAERCLRNDVSVETADISEASNERLAEQYEVNAVPTILVLDSTGAEIVRLVGAQTDAQIEGALLEAGLGSCGKEV